MNLFLLKKINKTALVIFLGFLAILSVSFFLPGYFSSADLLTNLPSYNTDFFIKPKNSLLSDPVTQFEPWREFSKEELLHGRIPLWNDFNGSGAPFFANQQNAIFFPLSILYYLLPLSAGLYVIHACKLYCFGVFMYFYLRSLRLGLISSILGACTTLFSAFFLVWLQWPHTNVFLFFPLLLTITEKIFKARKIQNKWYVFLALSYFLAVSGGHPETLLHISIIHVLYSMYRIKDRKRLLAVFISIISGFLLASFLLFPFIEYLLNSSAFSNRLKNDTNISLPVISIIQYIFPFILGAPHVLFYRPISELTNFQEAIGGYTGVSVFITGLYGFFKFWKVKVIRFWSIAVIMIFLFSYGVWPFSLLLKIPILGITNNSRLVGFLGVGFGVSCAFIYEKLFLSKKKIPSNYKIVIYCILILLVVSSLVIVLSSYLLENQSQTVKQFILFLKQHVLLIMLSTSMYAGLFFLLRRSRSKFLWVLLLLSISIQTILLFASYNPVIKKESFYPLSPLIRKLQMLPKGNILEVGNMNFPENINIIYGLYHAQNYDAMQVRSYQENFDKVFPEKSRWGKPEGVTYQGLKKMGISYVISDYDLRYSLKTVQEKQTQVSIPLLDTNPVRLYIKQTVSLKGVRLMFATHNRHNPCFIHFSLFNSETEKESYTRIIRCDEVNNFMYYTIQFPINIYENKSYIFMVRGVNTGINNYVSLVGEGKNPYYALLTNEKTSLYDDLTPEFTNKSLILFSVSGSGRMSLSHDQYKITTDTSLKKEFLVHTRKSQITTVFMTKYPGWNVFIDSKLVKLEEGNPFISFFLPEGEHVVKIVYMPISFYIGLLVSFGTLCILIIFISRKMRNTLWFKDVHGIWKKWAEKYRDISFFWHSAVIIGGVVVSSLLYITLIRFFHPTFFVPKTSAINWFTVHKYPRQQDYFYFYTAVSFILIVTIMLWVICLWKKTKK
jgi:hypothetical protein